MIKNSTFASEEPIYFQIVVDLKSDIFAGRFSPGDLLPSESTIAKRFKVSRETVRKGLKELEHEGFIYSRQGKGYFVAQPDHNQYNLFYTDDETGFSSKYHQIHVIDPTPELISALQLPTKKSIIKISRIILSENRPVAYDLKYLPYSKGMPIIESEIMYAVFPDIAAAKATPFTFYTEMEIFAGFGDKEVQSALECGAKDPLLIVCRYIIGMDSERIGYGKKYMNNQYGNMKAQSGYKSE